MSTDWQQILFDPQNNLIGRLDRLAKKRFWDENIADEAFNWVLDKLKANNWSRLDSFNGSAKPSTYLHTVFIHSLENFSREKFGYPRPKTWIKNQGSFWVKIWKLLCLEREPLEKIRINLSDGSEQREDEIKKIITLIKAKEPNCAKQEALTTIGGGDENKESVEKEEDGSLLGYQQGRRSTEDILQADNYERLTEIIALLTGFAPTLSKTDDALHNKTLKKLAQSLNITANETLLLKMKYQQSMSDSAIGRALDMSNYQVKTHLGMIVSRLTDVLKDGEIIFSKK